MSEPASISSGIAARYAQAVFELAQDQGHLDKLENDIQILKEVLSQSVDLMSLINSPVYSREAQSKAVLAVAAKMKLTKTMSNTLGLMAEYVRLALSQWKPRAIVDDVTVTPRVSTEGVVDIAIVYTVQATNDRRNLVYPFYVIPEETES